MMEWINALMNYFVLHPYRLWGLLFIIA
ncbi:DedA family protein, partial [Shigella flexneri]|nr:DedA family protein [Shigella flexneri]